MEEKAVERVEEKLEEKIEEKAEKTTEKKTAEEKTTKNPGAEEAAEEKTGDTEDKPEEATEEQAENPESKGTKGKRKVGRIIAGALELAAALALTVLAGWLFRNTTGVRLLYVSVALGRVSRYYWIAMVAAVVFLAAGIVTIKASGVKKDGDGEIKC
ncbi:MAG: hypothetical protein NC432_03250 [Roseburia sp.]|nr:hypothetical protein [Roseburia sp.]MCM1097049.1 hypothetical protein [Ruminococcus flavefaciens]